MSQQVGPTGRKRSSGSRMLRESLVPSSTCPRSSVRAMSTLWGIEGDLLVMPRLPVPPRDPAGAVAEHGPDIAVAVADGQETIW